MPEEDQEKGVVFQYFGLYVDTVRSSSVLTLK